MSLRYLVLENGLTENQLRQSTLKSSLIEWIFRPLLKLERCTPINTPVTLQSRCGVEVTPCFSSLATVTKDSLRTSLAFVLSQQPSYSASSSTLVEALGVAVRRYHFCNSKKNFLRFHYSTIFLKKYYFFLDTYRTIFFKT